MLFVQTNMMRLWRRGRKHYCFHCIYVCMKKMHNFIQLLLGICWAEMCERVCYMYIFHCIPIRLASSAIKTLRTYPLKSKKKHKKTNGNQTNWKSGWKCLKQLKPNARDNHSNGWSVGRMQLWSNETLDKNICCENHIVTQLRCNTQNVTST